MERTRGSGAHAGRSRSTPTFVTTSSMDFAEANPKTVVRVGSMDAGAFPNDKAIGVSNDGGKTWNNAGLPTDGAASGTIAVDTDGEHMGWSTGAKGVFTSHFSPYSWTTSEGIVAGAVVRSDRVNSSSSMASRTEPSTCAPTEVPTSRLQRPRAYPRRRPFRPSGGEGDLWVAGDEDGRWHSADSGATFAKVAGLKALRSLGLGRPQPVRPILPFT